MTLTATTTAKFDRILNLEDAVRLSGAVVAFQTSGVSNYRAGQQATGHAADKARLFAAIDALTADEVTAFAAYRVTARA